MERYVVLAKSDFSEFIKKLSQVQKLVAPVKKGEKAFSFEEVENSEDIELKYTPTILPPKKYFLPQNETLIEYDIDKNKQEATLYYDNLTLFGVHTCDLAGIQCLNIALSDKPSDMNYKFRRSKITIIGLECSDYCDEFACCSLLHNHNPNGGYDLFFTELKNHFYIHVNTSQGEDLLEKTGLVAPADEKIIKELNALREEKKKVFKPELNIEYDKLKPLFDNAFEHKVWEDISNKCLSCGNCTNVCPTCYCFDIEDEINLDMKTGQLKRKWDSCQSRPFAMIAGGENFRPERGQRQRHRYMRKFNYPVERYRRYFCTGCGRCTRTCMADISLKDTIDTLIKTVKVR